MREEHKLHPPWLTYQSCRRRKFHSCSQLLVIPHIISRRTRKEKTKKTPPTPLQISPWSPPTHMTVRGPSKPDPRADADAVQRGGRGGRQRGRPIGTRLQAPRHGDEGPKVRLGTRDMEKKNMETGRALGWVGLGAEGGSETKTLVFCVWGVGWVVAVAVVIRSIWGEEVLHERRGGSVRDA